MTDADRAAARRRWIVCGMLFAATAINYVDRQMIGVLKPTIAAEFGWNEEAYADLVFWFQAAYAVGYLAFGRIIDALGARTGYAVAFAIWTAGHTLCGFASSAFGFSAARMLLGLGESGNFPAGLKAVSEWFPQDRRAFATGIFNAGANVGAILTPAIIPWIVVDLHLGWRAAFVVTGAVSLAWLAAWIAIYRRPPLRDDAAAGPRIAWRTLLRRRETWAYAMGKLLTDPVWFLFLFWTPDFLAKTYHLDLKSFGPPLIAIYLLSDVGSVAGGWLSGALMKRGLGVNRARKLTMLACALAVTPIMLVQFASSLWIAVAIVGLAAAAHQAFAANLYTLPSDLFPPDAVGSVVGLGGTLGAIGGMAMAKATGYSLQTTGSYTAIFAVAGCAYLVALGVIQMLSPKLRAVTDWRRRA